MDSLTNQCKRISTRLLPPGLVFSTEGQTKGGWAGLRPELAWLVRAETPARRRSVAPMGGYLASREVLTACRSATRIVRARGSSTSLRILPTYISYRSWEAGLTPPSLATSLGSAHRSEIRTPFVRPIVDYVVSEYTNPIPNKWDRVKTHV